MYGLEFVVVLFFAEPYKDDRTPLKYISSDLRFVSYILSSQHLTELYMLAISDAGSKVSIYCPLPSDS